MRSIILFAVLLVAFQAKADFAHTVLISSVQVDADEMARTGVLRHCGRNGGRREGIGMGATPEAALRNCCFYGKYQIVEKAVAWSPVRRMWFAVIRYR